jgi:hypothetical protein
MSAIGGKAEHRPDCTAKWLTFSNETVCCALREKAALVASWGQPPKFGKGAGGWEHRVPLPDMIWGRWD